MRTVGCILGERCEVRADGSNLHTDKLEGLGYLRAAPRSLVYVGYRCIKRTAGCLEQQSRAHTIGNERFR
jgi:hypothetical protein